MRLIDADALKKAILEERDKIPRFVPAAVYEFEDAKPYRHGDSMRGGIRKALRCLEQCPSIEAEPVKHGRWASIEDKPMLIYECSLCKSRWSYGAVIQMNYCPNCGAKMDLEDSNDL